MDSPNRTVGSEKQDCEFEEGNNESNWSGVEERPSWFVGSRAVHCTISDIPSFHFLRY